MIKWGFIGCGSVVENKSGEAFNLEGKSQVLAVMCRRLEHAKAYALSHGVPYYYDNADEIIGNEEIDAIYIATPPSTHMLYAKQAISAGKAVYIEKPLGISEEECVEVLSLAKEKNIPVFVAYYRRGLEKFHDIKELVARGEIGEIRSVNVIHYEKAGTGEYEWRRDPSVAGGGLFYDLGCHTLDILDYIVSPIAEVFGFSDNQRKIYDSDDTVTASFQFTNGALGTGIWCFDVDEDKEQVQIIGNKGKVVFNVYGNSLKIIRDGIVEEREYTTPTFIQEPLIHNVIGALQGEVKARSTGDTAMRTVKVMDKIVGA